ncbi:protein unc-13 homolog 4B-like [Ctenocephalides felis]|uniref:protein unc-13 homolog 4B-like n=1 Tax=Ctenocephalides felis TaxID=7515 RepID=UPI000E6E573E|nr:protein unc-13 homolog 4B-like [Ctenocephalides felis]
MFKLKIPPSLYASLLETLDVLHESFGIGGGSSSCTSEPNSRCASPTPVQRARLDECREQEALDREQLEQMRELLRLHALETGDLIHRFHLDRLKEQESMQDTPYGILTVRCRLQNTHLRVEIMSARNLKPTDSNGSCDPFVRVSLLPEDRFVGVSKPKTQSQSKTMFPLFDETFIIQLSEEHLAIEDALISFNVKDKDFLGMSNQLWPKPYELSDVPRDSDSDEQTHLTLSRPTA